MIDSIIRFITLQWLWEWLFGESKTPVAGSDDYPGPSLGGGVSSYRPPAPTGSGPLVARADLMRDMAERPSLLASSILPPPPKKKKVDDDDNYTPYVPPVVSTPTYDSPSPSYESPSYDPPSYDSSPSSSDSSFGGGDFGGGGASGDY